MKLDCGHESNGNGGIMTTRGLLCFWCMVKPWIEKKRSPRRSHEDVVLEREERARAVAFRREFNCRKRAEREARKNGVKHE